MAFAERVFSRSRSPVTPLVPAKAHGRKVVIAGLDPAIHHLCKKLLAKTMDARVKPAHDWLD